MNKKITFVIVLVVVILIVLFTSQSKEEKITTAKEKIKIGVILPLTGPAASVTEDLQKSLKMYQARSKNIELVIQDDQCSGKGALSSYNIMKNQGIKIYIVACSGSIIALAPVIKEDHNVILTGFGGSIDIRKTGDEVIRFIPDGLTIAEGMINLIKSSPNKTYAVLNEQQDYAQSVADKLQQEVGSQLILKETYKGDDTTFKTQLAKIKESKADALVIIPVSETASQIVYKEMKDLGLKKEILGEVNVCDYKVQPKDFGFHGSCFSTVLETEGYKNYLADFKKNYNSAPQFPFYTAITYDVVSITDKLLDGVKKVDNKTIDKLKAEILKGIKGEITDYQFTPDGEVISGDYLKRVDF